MKKQNGFSFLLMLLCFSLILISVCGCAEESTLTDNATSVNQSVNSLTISDENSDVGSVTSEETSTSSKVVVNSSSSKPSVTTSKPKNSTSSNNTSSEKPIKKEEINVYGNTHGNLMNDAKVCSQGDWIYYSTFDAIYKMKKDGTQNQKIYNSSGISMSVCGEWLYFSEDQYEYSRMKTDGTERKRILKNVRYLTVVNRKIYYTDKDTGYMYRINENGSNKILLIEQDCGLSINVLEDMIFWSEGGNLYRSDINGKNIKCILNSHFNNFVAYNGYLYESANINIADYNGKIVKQLFKDGGAMDINISDGWIYYSYWDDKGSIYKCKLDGSEIQKLGDISAININVVGDWIFYREMLYEKDEKDGSIHGQSNDLYRMKTDGSENQVIAKWDWSYFEW